MGETIDNRPSASDVYLLLAQNNFQWHSGRSLEEVTTIWSTTRLWLTTDSTTTLSGPVCFHPCSFMAVHLIAEVLQVRLTCQVGRAAPGAGHEGAEAEHTASLKTLSGFTPNKVERPSETSPDLLTWSQGNLCQHYHPHSLNRLNLQCVALLSVDFCSSASLESRVFSLKAFLVLEDRNALWYKWSQVPRTFSVPPPSLCISVSSSFRSWTSSKPTAITLKLQVTREVRKSNFFRTFFLGVSLSGPKVLFYCDIAEEGSWAWKVTSALTAICMAANGLDLHCEVEYSEH